MKFLNHPLLILLLTVFATVSANAQIPQNIEVEGEATALLDYFLFAGALVVVAIAIVVLLRVFKKK